MTRLDRKILCIMFLLIMRGIYALIVVLIPHENEYTKSLFDAHQEFTKEVREWADLSAEEAGE